MTNFLHVNSDINGCHLKTRALAWEHWGFVPCYSSEPRLSMGFWVRMWYWIMVPNMQHTAVQKANKKTLSFSDFGHFWGCWSRFWCCLQTFVCLDALLWKSTVASCTFVHPDFPLHLLTWHLVGKKMVLFAKFWGWEQLSQSLRCVVVVVYIQVRSAINPILSFQTFVVISACMLIAEPKSSAKTVDKCSALRLP